ncbi:MAG: 4-hydroxythreonine-4-phosphate dehydrogenase PdxA, partial [Acidiferrobacteraceae bacterium]
MFVSLPESRPPAPERPVIAVTGGEPAGIGPELVARLLADVWPARVAYVGDHELLRARAEALGFDLGEPLGGVDIRLRVASLPGRLDRRNAPYVVETLERAVQGCLSGEFDALVT